MRHSSADPTFISDRFVFSSTARKRKSIEDLNRQMQKSKLPSTASPPLAWKKTKIFKYRRSERPLPSSWRWGTHYVISLSAVPPSAIFLFFLVAAGAAHPAHTELFLRSAPSELFPPWTNTTDQTLVRLPDTAGEPQWSCSSPLLLLEGAHVWGFMLKNKFNAFETHVWPSSFSLEEVEIIFWHGG